MQATNRITAFYETQKLVPFDEVTELEADAWNDGYSKGYEHGIFVWVLAGVAGMVFGFLVGVVV
jgi:hypothetical protein